MKDTRNTRPLRSLSQRLLSAFAAILLAAGITTLGINYLWVRSSLEEQVQERAEALANSLVFATEGVIEVGYTVIMRRTVQNYAILPAILEVAIVNPDRTVVANSKAVLQNSLYYRLGEQISDPLETAVSTGIGTDLEAVESNKSILVKILPFRSTLFGSSDRRGVAILFVDRAEMEKEIRQTFLFSTAIMTMGMGTILIVMGLSIQNIVLRPLGSLDRAVNFSKDANCFTIPPNLKSKEFQSLAITILEAYDRLQNEINERRQAEASLREKSEQLEQTIMELKQTQSQLIQTEKMSSLGQMVAGIAHEINNPVSFIAGNVVHASEYFQDFLRLFKSYQEIYFDPHPEIKNITEEIDFYFAIEDFQIMLDSMKIGADRIRNIVLSLRNFSRLDEAEMKEADVHEGIDNTLLILQHRLESKMDRLEIKIIKNYGNIPRIECYPSQLNQVFMNILSNAIDALEERAIENTNFSPQIKISTEIRDRERISKSQSYTLNSTSLIICIADNGFGISSEIKERLFDPFFTTKPVGKGTGLGLSISYQIVVDRHKGLLVCHSQPEKGAEFEIVIPVFQ